MAEESGLLQLDEQNEPANAKFYLIEVLHLTAQTTNSSVGTGGQCRFLWQIKRITVLAAKT